MGSGIPCLAGRFINDSLNVRRAKRRGAALTRLSTLELAPVLRFVRLFVYEKGRVHKPPWRKGGKPRGFQDGGRVLVETPAPPLCALFTCTACSITETVRVPKWGGGRDLCKHLSSTACIFL